MRKVRANRLTVPQIVQPVERQQHTARPGVIRYLGAAERGVAVGAATPMILIK
jgi:hypothetical protein